MSLVHIVRQCARPVVRFARSASFLILRRIAERRVVCGIEIVSALSLGEESPHIRAAAQAVELIARHDRALLLRIRQHVRAILIGKMGPGFEQKRRICILRDADLESLPVERIALQIAHEAAHARFFDAGCDYGPESRARIERYCVRAELRLAQRIPGGKALLDASARQLEDPWWSDQQLYERKEAMWRDAGAPNWLLRLGRRLFG